MLSSWLLKFLKKKENISGVFCDKTSGADESYRKRSLFGPRGINPGGISVHDGVQGVGGGHNSKQKRW